MAGIGKLAAASAQFSGVGLVAIANEITDYGTAKLNSITALKQLGNILSLDFSGDEASLEQWLDINGKAVTATTKAGTYKWDIVLMDYTKESIMKFFQGTEITVETADMPDWMEQSADFKLIGFGDKIPVLEVPLIYTNELMNKWMIIPKAKIIASEGTNSNNKTIKLSVLAQDVSTANLKTVMYSDTGAAIFEA